MSPPEILLVFRRAPAALPRRELKDFAQQLRQQVSGGRGFVCMITDDRELRRLNREFLQNDYPTDVLSFPSETPEGDLGEIAISSGRAAAQAIEFRHSVTQEIQILMLHGLLHLTGMDHESDAGEMLRAEKRWRKHFSLPNGLIERVQV